MTVTLRSWPPREVRVHLLYSTSKARVLRLCGIEQCQLALQYMSTYRVLIGRSSQLLLILKSFLMVANTL